MKAKISQFGEKICAVIETVWRAIIKNSAGLLPYLGIKQELNAWHISTEFSYQRTADTPQTYLTSGRRRMPPRAHLSSGWRCSVELCTHCHKPSPTKRQRNKQIQSRETSRLKSVTLQEVDTMFDPSRLSQPLHSFGASWIMAALIYNRNISPAALHRDFYSRFWGFVTIENTLTRHFRWDPCFDWLS